MICRFIAISLIVNLIYASNSEPVGNTIIKVDSCCGCRTTKDDWCDHGEKLLQNISTKVHELKERLEEMIVTLNIGPNSRDCQDVQSLGNSKTGVYMIYPQRTVGFPVRCDMNGGWTVILRRMSESNFHKTWNDFQVGFGNLSENFWLGNQQIHSITTEGWYELRVELQTLSGIAAYAEYNVFAVGNVESGYKLTVDGYHGNAGDSLKYHNGRMFSTKDRDNDAWSDNCAQKWSGAWWNGACDQANLNKNYTSLEWESFTGSDDPLRFAEMKIRRWQPESDSRPSF